MEEKDLNEMKLYRKKMNEKNSAAKASVGSPDKKNAGMWKVMGKVWALYEKEREVFWYLVSGLGTTLVN